MKTHKFLGILHRCDEERIKKELFYNRLLELRDNNYTQNQIIEYLGIKQEDTYRKYETTPGEMKVKHLVALAKLYNVSTDYLLGLSDFKHIENEEICNLTGLSEESIEVLREIKRSIPPKSYKDGEEVEYINLPPNMKYYDKEGNEIELINKYYEYSPEENIKIIAAIDYILSKSEIRNNYISDKTKEKIKKFRYVKQGKFIFNLFNLIYDYIFVLPDIEYKTDRNEEASFINAINTNNGYIEPLFTERLLKQVKKEEINKLLDTYQEEHDKEFYSFSFSELENKHNDNNKGIPFFSENTK